MKILFIANYVSLPWENGNSRFIYLLNSIDYSKHNVELITSSFSHALKKHRKLDFKKVNALKYKLTLIDEPGYRNNVSFARMYSHKFLSKNLKEYFAKIKIKPDVIYCAVPSLDLAYEAAVYAEKNKIRFIIDVQDIWPEAFQMVFNPPVVGKILYSPLKRKADKIYSMADQIVAVSETYAKRALTVNKKTKQYLSVYLGTALDAFDAASKNQEKKEKNTIKIAYVGTLGHSYNIKGVIDALSMINNDKIKFIIMGDGPMRQEFESYAKEKSIDCEFKGKIRYEDMVACLCSCDIAVNPITHGAAQSIINKVGDYAAAGLPVVNTQECPEYRNLVDDYQIGVNCENGNIKQLSEAINRLINDRDLRKRLGKNNRRLAEEKFDRLKTYQEILDLIYGENVNECN